MLGDVEIVAVQDGLGDALRVADSLGVDVWLCEAA